MSFTDTNSITFTVGSKLAEVELAFIKKTLEANNGNRTHTAKALGIGIRTLQRKLRGAGLSEYLLNQTKKADTTAEATSEVKPTEAAA